MSGRGDATDSADALRERILVAVLRVLVVGGFLGLWEIAAQRRWIDPFFSSSPREVGRDLALLWADPTLFRHVWVTVLETLLGFASGVLLGFGSGIALHATPRWRRVLDPILGALYSTPRMALAPLFILWFGLGILSKVVFAFSVVYFVVLFTTLAGLDGVDRAMVDAVRVMGATRWQLLWKVTLPSIVPWVMSGMRTGMGLALLGTIVGEYVGGVEGLGWMINNAAGLFLTARVFSTLAILMVVSVALNTAIALLERWLLRWRLTPHTLA